VPLLLAELPRRKTMTSKMDRIHDEGTEHEVDIWLEVRQLADLAAERGPEWLVCLALSAATSLYLRSDRSDEAMKANEAIDRAFNRLYQTVEDRWFEAEEVA
jgi:hypothetical protein